MDDLIRYAYAAVTLLFLGSALLIAAVLSGVWFFLAAILSGQTSTPPRAALVLSLLLIGYCLIGLLLRRFRIT